jgi:hypothetical protein
MTRTLPFTLLGIFVLVVSLAGLIGVGLAIVAIAEGDGADFTGKWRSPAGDDVTLEIAQHDGVYVASFEGRDGAWRRRATMTLVDRLQIAGPLAELEGVPTGDDPPAVAGAPAGASLSIASVGHYTLAVSVRAAGEDWWTDLGSYQRVGLSSNPYERAAMIALGLLVAVATVLILAIPAMSRRSSSRPVEPGEAVARVATVLAGVGLLVALLVGQPLMATLVLLVLFPAWLVQFLKSLPEEVPSAGAFLGYLLSSSRRAEIRADIAAQEAQAARGAALQTSLQELIEDRSTARPAPGSGDTGS